MISAAADANDNAPTIVDAVMVYDKSLLPGVLAMKAKDWKAKHEQLQNDFPNGFEVREWEVVPGEQVDVTKLPFRSGGVALFVFANYPGDGEYRVRLDTWRKPRVILKDKSLTVVDRP